MEGSGGPGVDANGPIAAPSSPVSSTIGPPLSPEELDDESQSSLTDVTQMWIKFGKTFAMIFPIYVLGYFEFSFSWVLIGLAMLFYWRKNHGSKDYRINRALAFLEHEDKAVRKSVPTAELPPWVSLLKLLHPVLSVLSCILTLSCIEYQPGVFSNWMTERIPCHSQILSVVSLPTDFLHFSSLELHKFEFFSQTNRG